MITAVAMADFVVKISLSRVLHVVNIASTFIEIYLSTGQREAAERLVDKWHMRPAFPLDAEKRKFMLSDFQFRPIFYLSVDGRASRNQHRQDGNFYFVHITILQSGQVPVTPRNKIPPPPNTMSGNLFLAQQSVTICLSDRCGGTG